MNPQNRAAVAYVPKVLHFIRSVNPSLGGPIQGIKALHTNQERFLDVGVVSLDSADDPWVKDFPLPLYPVGPGHGLYGFSGSAFAKLSSQIERVDAVVADGLWQYSSVLARRFAIHKGAKLYTFTHGMLDPWFKKQYPFKHLKKCLYWPMGDYRVLRDSSKVLFTTQLECDLARKSFKWLYRANEFVLGLGCPPPPPKSALQTEAFYSIFPEAREKKVILFLSRIHEKKGCDIGLKAFARTFARDDSFVLVMAGPGHSSYIENLKNLAKEVGVEKRVFWPGMVSGDVKWGAFYNSEAFILPSHQENFGIVLAEALACGLPILTTCEVNIFQEIEKFKAGLISSDDVYGTVAIYDKFMKMKAQEKMELRKNSVECFGKCFNIVGASKRFAELIISELG